MNPDIVEDSALRAQVDAVVVKLRGLAHAVSAAGGGMERAFANERAAETALIIDVLEAVRPAFHWIAACNGPVRGVTGDAHDLVLVDRVPMRSANPDVREVEWLAFDHADLGLCVAYRGRGDESHPGTPTLMGAPASVPHWREGGPRLDHVLEQLVDQLLKHAAGNASRRRRDAAKMAEKLRAVQTLLRTP